MSNPFSRWIVAAGSLLVCSACGCSRLPPAPERPKFDAAAAAQAAIAKYDTNGDGKLDAKELQKCPALLEALPRADTDGDKMLSADEIAARIKHWFAAGTTIMNANTTVFLEGKALEGATVTYDPEEFLGPGFKQGKGVTENSGMAPITMGDAKYSGLYPGAYRVRISRIVGGKETIPARYNTDSELGKEVAPDVPKEQRSIEFRLKRR